MLVFAGICEMQGLPEYAPSFWQQEVSLLGYESFRKLGVPFSGVLIIRILLFRVLY